jgi:pantoate--beta-alanine ligase
MSGAAQTHGRGELIVARTIPQLREAVRGLRAAGRTIGLVPTMGALHDGHLSLVRAAIGRSDAPVATIFVNPTQFSPNEDFAAYPREEAADFAKLAANGCLVVFAPDLTEMAPEPSLTMVHVARLTDGLCGPFRPGHFDGVASVVTKLLMIALPDRAYFGEKDYQQLQVVRRLVFDLSIPVEIVGMPTIREADGLAMSSRNAYLDPAQRIVATALHGELMNAARAAADGRASCVAVSTSAALALLDAGFASVDYFTIVDAATLAPIERIAGPARVIAAARLGRTRLIDNVAV